MAVFVFVVFVALGAAIGGIIGSSIASGRLGYEHYSKAGMVFGGFVGLAAFGFWASDAVSKMAFT